jgi:hypothetical protein
MANGDLPLAGHNFGKYRSDFRARLVQPAANFFIRQFQGVRPRDRAVELDGEP